MNSPSTTPRRGRKALAWALGAALACAGLAACTTDDHQLPTIGGSQSRAGETDLAAIAKAYVDCMGDGGVDMTLQENTEQELAVAMFSEFQWYAACPPDGSCGGGSQTEMTEAQNNEMNAVFETPLQDGEAKLIIDGVDHSELFARCLAETGYDEQAAWGEGSFASDPEQLQRQVDSNNKWAACARENGWPTIKDSVMPTDLTNAIWPMIELPTTVTEDQLRQLIEVCPTFDAEQTEKLYQWWEDNPTATGYPDDYLPEPSVSIAYATPADPENPTPEDLADQERITKLYDILYEAQNAYWEEQMGASLPGATETAD